MCQLRGLFISLTYITANVREKNNRQIVAAAYMVEHSIKSTLKCGRCCNVKAAGDVGEVLEMRLKVEGLEQGQYEFWTESNDECGVKDESQMEFVKNFK
ncbi:hypothetical protein MLD38_010323 [Melastoma candidum]|uniref:Uncharacterized protein n=1 Tax=Melastoma candidum TaxID=119954 RepID=A0ACB9R2K5_9MYRT|nr:hypothetical protein MLD38_010323 [Melastoma candidum]